MADTDALVERIFEATVGSLELISVHLGRQLGLYRTLADAGPLTSSDLAGAASIDERYAREWLEQQAVAGFVEVDDPAVDAAKRRFSLPAEHARVLVDPVDGAHVGPFAEMVVGIAGVLPEVVEAYRSGDGVPYTRYGGPFRDGQGAINRPAFTHELAKWIRAAPDVHERLSADPPAKVADLGCGQGFSTLALARAYPKAQVTGVDSDEASVADARRLAEEEPDLGNVAYALSDASELATSGPYDLICVFEALHDMAHPAEVLAAARAALAEDGAVLVADERVAEQFTAPGDPVERIMYGWSVSHCLPASRVEADSAALGTALRPSTVRDLGAKAGFGQFETLPIENDFFRFYLLRR